jgi:hypothetical protein
MGVPEEMSKEKIRAEGAAYALASGLLIGSLGAAQRSLFRMPCEKRTKDNLETLLRLEIEELVQQVSPTVSLNLRALHAEYIRALNVQDVDINIRNFLV